MLTQTQTLREILQVYMHSKTHTDADCTLMSVFVQDCSKKCGTSFECEHAGKG